MGRGSPLGLVSSNPKSLGGHPDIRWVTRGRECRWEEDAGTVHVRPTDHADHVLASILAVFVSLVFCIPLRHLDDLMDAEGITPARTWPHFTRLFSSLTGMPPGRYRRHVRPAAG